LVGQDPDQAILDCYWLARWYHQSPEVFLAMPISRVLEHVARTHQIVQLRQQHDDTIDDDG